MKLRLKACFFVFICIPLFGLSQNKISKVEYLCTTDLVGIEKYDGLNTMYFNAHEAIYIHNDYPTEHASRRMSSDEANTHVIAVVRPDDEGLPVYRNVQTDTMIWKTHYGKGVPRIMEPLPEIDWEITDLTKKLDDFHCIKAIGTFYGREYEVWFTPDIPVPFGPYKLGGLPGLILQAQSKDNIIRYEFRSYDPETDEIKEVQPPQKGDLITLEAFKERKIRAWKKDFAKYGQGDRDPNSNAFIEKNKWRIYSNIKEYLEKENR